MSVEFILGLPGLSARALLAKARELGLPVMISANALSRSRIHPSDPDREDIRARLGPDGYARWLEATRYSKWGGFNLAPLANATGLECHLDSAGYVAMSRHRGYDWTVDDYMSVAAAYPWVRFSSMDLCVEASIAKDRTAVLDRIAGTINLNNACRRRAIDLGINDRFMPVIQGFTHEDYWMCIDRMPWLDEYPVVGVGSMCTRNVHGVNGIVHIVSMLDRHLPKGIRLHLFGLKSDGAEAIRGLGHRVASVDSQAYGTEARCRANRIRTGASHASARRDQRTGDLFGPSTPAAEPVANPEFSKSNEFVASIMEEWATKQARRLRKPGFTFQDSLLLEGQRPDPAPGTWEWAERIARNRLRNLVKSGEIEHNDVNERWVYDLAGEILTGEDRGSEFDRDYWDCRDVLMDAAAA